MEQDRRAGLYDVVAPNSALLRRTRSGLEAVEGSPLLLSAQKRAYTLRLPLNPVHVEDVDGSEVLRYHVADMVAGKLYRFKWHGEWCALPRSDDVVEILKSHPDEKRPRSRARSARFRASSSRQHLP